MANTILNFHFDYPHPSLRRLAYDLHAMNQYTNIIRSIIIGTTTIYQIHSRLPALSGGGLYHLWEHWSGCRKWAFVDNSINWKRTHFRLAKKHTCLIANSGYRILALSSQFRLAVRVSSHRDISPFLNKQASIIDIFQILKLKSFLTGELKHQIAAKKVSDSEGVVLIYMCI